MARSDFRNLNPALPDPADAQAIAARRQSLAPARGTGAAPVRKPAIVLQMDHARYLSQAALLEECGPPRLITHGVMLLALLIIIAVGGAAVTPIIIAAQAVGTVVPASSVQPIQHMDGGVVQHVAVREGDLVYKGSLILQLAGDDERERLDEISSDVAASAIEAERLRALASDRVPDFSAYSDRYASLADDHRLIFDQERKAINEVLAIHTKKVAQTENVTLELQTRLKGIQEQAAVVRQELSIYEKLRAKGLASQVRLLDAKQEHARLRTEANETRDQLATSRLKQDEARSALAEAMAAERRKTLDRLGDVVARLAKVTETQQRLAGAVKRLDIVAPVTGHVNKLIFSGPGGVISRGDVVAEIVPATDRKRVEARIEPRDIGFLEQGQKARIVIDGFDLSRFEAVPGRLQSLSPTSLVDDEGNRYFKAMIELETRSLSNGVTEFAIKPGMSVQATIVTGERTLMEYLLRPIYDSFGRAFSER